MAAIERLRQGGLLALALTSLIFNAGGAHADDSDPPSRIARLAFVEGSVSFQPAGTQDWVAAPLNRPLTSGDVLWVDNGSRAELQLDGSAVRLGNGTELSLIALSDDVTQLQMSSGTLILRVRQLDDNVTYEVDTPNLAFSVLRPGTYRISVDASGNNTSIIVRSGQGEVSGGNTAYTVQSGDYDIFSGTAMSPLTAEAQPQAPDSDAFDDWSWDRDSRWDRSASAQYVSDDVVGYEDLDDQGSWTNTPDYGPVWYPNGVPGGWAPYQVGYWSYIAPWGYTWVDAQPWGFAPFHYGRWIWSGRSWGWVPSPPRPARGIYIRPVYAPALVAWVGAGAAVAWVALGPHEVYVPRYPVSANYVRNINLSNTTVNATVINNIYNTTVINNKTVNVTYVNRGAPGAITATSATAFTSGQPVAKNVIKVDPHQLAAAPIRPLAPAVVPTKQAVLGSSRVVATKPPQAVLTRAVVARTAPPAPPPAFEARQAAIKANGGKPLSVAQVSQLQHAATAARPAPIRITTRLAAPVHLAAQARVPAPPVTQIQIGHAAPAAVHPRELPRPPAPPSPASANSALEREQLQQQQQLRAQQEQERQRVQQQQELDHQRLAQQQADAARTQELERQHQQQTQELQQRHIAEQQALATKQQEEGRAAQAAPAPHQEPAPPAHKPAEPRKPE
jgi:FecR protein